LFFLQNYNLCNQCFNENIHSHHDFEFREFPVDNNLPKKDQEKGWSVVQRTLTDLLLVQSNPINLAHRHKREALLNRIGSLPSPSHELFQQQLPFTTQPSQQKQQKIPPSGIPLSFKHTAAQRAATIHTEVVSDSHAALLASFKCSVCSQSFPVGCRVKKLTNCGHYFHDTCIDKWLTESSNLCPGCSTQVYEIPRSVLIEHAHITSAASLYGIGSSNHFSITGKSPSASSGLTGVGFAAQTSVKSIHEQRLRRMTTRTKTLPHLGMQMHVQNELILAGTHLANKINASPQSMEPIHQMPRRDSSKLQGTIRKQIVSHTSVSLSCCIGFSLNIFLTTLF